MCNLYSVTTNQAAIRDLFKVTKDSAGNLPPMRGVFPDYPAPVVRNAGTDRELTMMRWGMPPPPKFGGPLVTNIRNTSSPHWRGWLKPETRCLVPANSFSEYAPETNPVTKKGDVLRSMTTGRCSRSLASGPSTGATVAPSLNRYRDRIWSMAF
jgi:putative SOS response-associated peptidase YedK